MANAVQEQGKLKPDFNARVPEYGDPVLTDTQKQAEAQKTAQQFMQFGGMGDSAPVKPINLLPTNDKEVNAIPVVAPKDSDIVTQSAVPDFVRQQIEMEKMTAPPVTTVAKEDTPVLDTTTTTTTNTNTGGGSGTYTPPKSTIPLPATVNIPGTEGSTDSNFVYNGSTDPALKMAKTNLENDITQALVGRGMLYSSIVQQEVQKGFQSLEVQFREQRYKEWTNERQQAMELQRFAWEAEDRQYEKWQREQSAKQANVRQALENDFLNLEYDEQQYQKMLKKWQSSDYATKDVADYFGTYSGALITDQRNAQQKISQKKQSLASSRMSFEKRLRDSQASELKAAYVESVRGEAKTGTAEMTDAEILKAPDVVLGNSSQQDAYSDYSSKFQMLKTNAQKTAYYKKLKADGLASQAMGPKLYYKLIIKMADALDNLTGGTVDTEGGLLDAYGGAQS